MEWALHSPMHVVCDRAEGVPSKKANATGLFVWAHLLDVDVLLVMTALLGCFVGVFSGRNRNTSTGNKLRAVEF